MTVLHLVHRVDEEELRARYSSQRGLTAELHFQIGPLSFPSETWNDFVVIILSWWLEEVRLLTAGATHVGTFRFMDGPYEMRVLTSDSAQWLIEGIGRRANGEDKQFSVIASPDQVVGEILRVSNELLGVVRKLGVWDQECAKLEALCSSSPY